LRFAGLLYSIYFYWTTSRPTKNTRGGGGHRRRGPVEYEVLPKLEQLPINGRIIYQVPGDGFCAFHSVLSLFREIRYLENLAYLKARHWENNFETVFFRPLIEDFVNALFMDPILKA